MNQEESEVMILEEDFDKNVDPTEQGPIHIL